MTFRENNRAITAADQIACVLERASGAGHLLWQRIRIENRASQEVREARAYNFPPGGSLRFEIGTEVILHHCGCEPLAPTERECRVNRRDIEIARVVGGEDDRRLPFGWRQRLAPAMM